MCYDVMELDLFQWALMSMSNNPIPLGRGLGSSGAAVVAGVMLGNEVGKLGFDKQRMLDYCLMIERHPDNITAAMMGGFYQAHIYEN